MSSVFEVQELVHPPEEARELALVGLGEKPHVQEDAPRDRQYEADDHAYEYAGGKRIGNGQHGLLLPYFNRIHHALPIEHKQYYFMSADEIYALSLKPVQTVSNRNTIVSEGPRALCSCPVGRKKKGAGWVEGEFTKARAPEAFLKMAREAAAEGLMAEAALPAAMSLAGQIARLESRFEEYYRLGEEDAEAKKAQSTLQALELMGKCEKQMADLKARFFEMAGLDRQYAARARLAELQCGAAEKGGEVVLKIEGFGEVPMQEE